MADQPASGFVRDDTGALVVVLKADAVAPLVWATGFLRDANGAIVITTPGA